MRIRYTLLGRRQREDSAQTLGGSVSSVAALHVFGECTWLCAHRGNNGETLARRKVLTRLTGGTRNGS